MISGQIQTAQDAKSGKTLRVQVNGEWYSTKNWEMRDMVGQVVSFEPSPWATPDGGTIFFINEYTGGSQTATPTPPAGHPLSSGAPPQGAPAAPAAPSPAPAAPVASPPAQSAGSPGISRDASIVAQALTKASVKPGDSVEAVWDRYTRYYALYQKWNGQPEDFNDNIPF